MAIPTEKIIRWFLSLGYSEDNLAELDSLEASHLASLIADNDWQPVPFQFPSGATQNPPGGKRPPPFTGPLPPCLQRSAGILSKKDQAKLTTKLLTQTGRGKRVCEACGHRGGRKTVRQYRCMIGVIELCKSCYATRLMRTP